MKIAIIKIGAIGDVLRTTSLLPGLKEKYGDLELTWVVAKEAYDIIRTNPFINRILIAEQISRIEGEYDLLINLEEDKKACDLASGAVKKKIFGAYSRDSRIIYSDDSSGWFDLSLISRYGREKADKLKKINKMSYQEIISGLLGIKNSRPVLNLGREEEEFAQRFKKDNGIGGDDFVIGVNAGAGKRWKYKSLGHEKTVQLIEGVKREFGAKIVVFGGPGDRQINKEIASRTKAIDGSNYMPLLGFASLINLCGVLITSDSLALHIAAALDKEVVVFFGPTSPSEIELYGRGIKLAPEMDCIGCFKNDCGLSPVCMDRIAISGFIDAIKKIMPVPGSKAFNVAHTR